MPGIASHALALALIFVLPALSAYTARQLRALGRPLTEAELCSRYRRGIAIQWGLVTVLAVVAWRDGLAPADLGWVLPSASVGTAVSVVAVTAATLWLWSRVRVTRSDADFREAVREVETGLELVMPRTRRELGWFRALGVTAALCEEPLYRGFVLGYLWVFLPPVAAVVGAAALFGVAHVYQGAVGMLKTGVVGLILVALYLASGSSLLLPIALHAAIDLLNGQILFDSHAGGDLR